MDSRQRLRRCYFHEELDRPGVYVRTGYPRGDPTYDRLRAHLQQHSELKASWSAAALQTLPPTDVCYQPHSEDWRRRVTTLHTPGGDLTATRMESLRGQPGLAEAYFLTSRQDAEKYLSLPMPEIGGDASGFHQAAEAMGDRGIVDVSLGRCPGGFAAGLFGSETFALLSVTDRDVLHALLDRQMQIILSCLKCALGLGAGPYFAMAGEEFCVPPLHGPADFDDFIIRYEKPIIDLVHEAGGRVHVHCHGSIRKVMPGFLEMGVDVLHPFEAPPMGDITPAEAKRLAAGKMTLEGNIQIADMYDGTPADIRRQVQALIADCFDDRRGLIVCPSASPYQRGKGEQCFENFKAMVDTVINWTA